MGVESLTVEITGDGVSIETKQILWPGRSRQGKVSYFGLKQLPGGGATAGQFWLMRGSGDVADAPGAADMDVVVSTVSITPLTPHADDAFERSTIDFPPVTKGLRLVADITAGVGPWTIEARIDLEELS